MCVMLLAGSLVLHRHAGAGASQSCVCRCLLALQEEGNYKLAHAKMFSTLQQLQAMGAAVPLEFRQALALLHSYVLVKSLLAVGDHMGAARMLVRVAGNISRYGRGVSGCSAMGATCCLP